jgi:hypothetical protein
MIVTKRDVIFLKYSDLKDESKSKYMKDLSWMDFTCLTAKIVNRAWYIDYSMANRINVIKDKGELTIKRKP